LYRKSEYTFYIRYLFPKILPFFGNNVENAW